MTTQTNAGLKSATGGRAATLANVCVILLVGCCLCASLAISLF